MKCLFNLFIVFIFSVPVFAADWPQIQCDAARSGFAADTNALPIRDVSTNTQGESPGDDPYQFSWRWYPYAAADSNHHTSICGLVQPVVKDNVLCVGYYDGNMYGVDANVGTQIWKFHAGGPILHTAGFASNVVVFGSQDRKVYGLNAKTGTKIWELKTGYPVRTAPCIFNNICYIGSTDGKLYAINALTGTKIWEYDSGAPILTTASCDASGNIYCGNEAVFAFSLTPAGAERWKTRLCGQSVMGFWPVINNSKNQVVYRTQPQRNFHRNLTQGDYTVRYDSAGVMRVNTWTNNPAEGEAIGDILPEQERIRQHLISNPIEQTSFILNLANGSEINTLPILYTVGEGSVPTPPVLDLESANYISFWRSYYAAFDSGSQVRYYSAIGKLNPDNFEFFHFSLPKSYHGQFHLVGDESSIFSVMKGYLLISGRGKIGGIRLDDDIVFHIAESERVPGNNGNEYILGGTPYAYDNAEWPEHSILGGGGQGGNLVAAASVADGKIFWVARWGLIIALEPK